MDAFPVKKGHPLVIPKKHTDYIFDLTKKEYAALLESSRKIAIVMKRALKAERIAVIVEGFSVPHVHVHLFPLNKGFQITVNERRLKRSPKREARVARLLRSHFRR